MESSQSLTVSIYDELGREIKVLISSEKAAHGAYNLVWDGTDNNGRAVSAGSYFVFIKKGENKKTKQVLIIK